MGIINVKDRVEKEYSYVTFQKEEGEPANDCYIVCFCNSENGDPVSIVSSPMPIHLGDIYGAINGGSGSFSVSGLHVYVDRSVSTYTHNDTGEGVVSVPLRQTAAQVGTSSWYANELSRSPIVAYGDNFRVRAVADAGYQVSMFAMDYRGNTPTYLREVYETTPSWEGNEVYTGYIMVDQSYANTEKELRSDMGDAPFSRYMVGLEPRKYSIKFTVVEGAENIDRIGYAVVKPDGSTRTGWSTSTDVSSTIEAYFGDTVLAYAVPKNHYYITGQLSGHEDDDNPLELTIDTPNRLETLLISYAAASAPYTISIYLDRGIAKMWYRQSDDSVWRYVTESSYQFKDIASGVTVDAYPEFKSGYEPRDSWINVGRANPKTFSPDQWGEVLIGCNSAKLSNGLISVNSIIRKNAGSMYSDESTRFVVGSNPVTMDGIYNLGINRHPRRSAFVQYYAANSDVTVNERDYASIYTPGQTIYAYYTMNGEYCVTLGSLTVQFD